MPNVNNEVDVMNHLVTLITERVVAQIKAQGVQNFAMSERCDDLETECIINAGAIKTQTDRIGVLEARVSTLTERINKHQLQCEDASREARMAHLRLDQHMGAIETIDASIKHLTDQLSAVKGTYINLDASIKHMVSTYDTRIDGLVEHREEIDKQVNRLTDAINAQAPRIEALDLLERKVNVLGASSTLTEQGLYERIREYLRNEVTIRLDC